MVPENHSSALWIPALLLAALPASAQTRGADGFLEIQRIDADRPAVESREALQDLFASDPASIREALAAGGFTGDADAVLAAVADGRFAETTFATGLEMEWMGTPTGAARKVRFTGPEGMPAFALGLTEGNARYRFAIPKESGAVALIAQEQMGGAPPTIHFEASGPYTHASARITVDVRLADGSELEVTLTDPSGERTSPDMDRSGIRSNWTGQLMDEGTWEAEARVTRSGFDARTVRESLTLSDGAPVCSASLSISDQEVVYDSATIVVNTCESRATTGEIATGYVRIERDGVQIASLDMSDSCERSFIVPGGGDYTALVEIADSRNVRATCEASVGATEVHPRFWPTLDLAGGVYRSDRDDIVSDPSAPLAGGAIGGALDVRPGPGGGTRILGRVASGVAHNRWFGSAIDLGILQYGESGFVGGGIGLWGVGDADIVDAGIFGAGGVGLPLWTAAGRAHLFTELRLFGKKLSAIQDNYSATVGIRFEFRPVHRIKGR